MSEDRGGYARTRNQRAEQPRLSAAAGESAEWSWHYLRTRTATPPLELAAFRMSRGNQKIPEAEDHSSIMITMGKSWPREKVLGYCMLPLNFLVISGTWSSRYDFSS